MIQLVGPLVGCQWKYLNCGWTYTALTPLREPETKKKVCQMYGKRMHGCKMHGKRMLRMQGCHESVQQMYTNGIRALLLYAKQCIPEAYVACSIYASCIRQALLDFHFLTKTETHLLFRLHSLTSVASGTETPIFTAPTSFPPFFKLRFFGVWLLVDLIFILFIIYYF